MGSLASGLVSRMVNALPPLELAITARGKL